MADLRSCTAWTISMQAFTRDCVGKEISAGSGRGDEGEISPSPHLDSPRESGKTDLFLIESPDLCPHPVRGLCNRSNVPRGVLCLFLYRPDHLAQVVQGLQLVSESGVVVGGDELV